jgi:hypothetical protein
MCAIDISTTAGTLGQCASGSNLSLVYPVHKGLLFNPKDNSSGKLDMYYLNYSWRTRVVRQW